MSTDRAGGDPTPRAGEGGAYRKTPTQLASDPAFTGTYAKVSRPPTFVPLGDSTSAVPGAGVTYPELLAAVTDRKFRLLYNAGVPGNTTAQMLARVQTDVVAKAPSYCIVLGGTNDIGGAVALTTTAANLNAMYDALLAAGIVPIAATITPRNANADVANVRDLNNWIRGNAAIRGIHCLDINAALVDPATSFYQAGLNADTIHPNAAGVVAMANAAKTLLTSGLSAPQPSSLLPIEWSQSAWSGGNGYSQQFCVNPLMIDTNSDGTPDNWSLSTGGGASVTKTVATDSRFVGNAMKWVCTASTGFHTMQQGLNTPSWSVGDKVRLYVRAAVESTSGITGTSGFIAKLNAAGANQSAYAMQQWSAAINSGVFTADMTVPVGTTSLSVQLDAQLGGGSGTVYWGQVGVLNLTKLGLTALP